MSTFTWLVTGSSSGMGANITLAALAAGHKVVATARNIAKAKESFPEIENRGGQWITLDVTSPDTKDIVEKAVQEHDVNVVVNNAGYALRGVLEDLRYQPSSSILRLREADNTDPSMSDIRAQIETNLFGLLAVTKGCIPTFRSRRSGTIVNISSTSGMTGNAGYSLYAASKFAVEGASESLAAELAPFNIRVLVVEPGAFRTNFQAAIQSPDQVSEPYRGTTADLIAQRISSTHGKQPGDPQKAAATIVEVVTGSGRGKDVEGQLRLPLGE